MASYNNAIIVEVYATNDYSGNPLTIEWVSKEANFPVVPPASMEKFITSLLDISLEGEVNFGFRYYGGAPVKTTTYDIDNIRVTVN